MLSQVGLARIFALTWCRSFSVCYVTDDLASFGQIFGMFSITAAVAS